MHVLLTESAFGDSGFLVQPLRDAGCLVSRCHSRAGVRRAPAPGGRCPLDEPFAQPDLVCAVRDHVPVALVSPDVCVRAEVPPGLENRVTVVDVDGLLATCRAASGELGVLG
ncbi:hypothetical protein [Amycolatopsis sp. MtRt-6]|uniref:hypothetical protein n=1 Tax=Amycolatopsis sp. MtRt-6 TaxID=2792782 RepID=UPI001A8E9FE8|nr:hypothetical protein [Amycolatopsis sp. MtRt-6]